MNSENFLSCPTAVPRRRCILPGLALAILTLPACTPPSPVGGDAGQPAETTTGAGPEETVVPVSQLEALLARLGEPPLAENCAEDTTSYRISRLEWERGAAAVRVFSTPDGRGYRSVFSEAMGQAISSDGWLDERMWDRVEREFWASDFWNIEPDAFAGDGTWGGVMFVEACRDGVYHYLQSEPRHHWLRHIVSLLSRIGKLQWLETGRSDHS